MNDQDGFPPLRALVVEDEDNLLELIGEMLRCFGCESDLTSDGEEALRLVETNGYDLVILDYVLPGRAGPDLYRELVRRAPHLESRVVFMTGADPESEPLRGFFEESRRPTLRKPFGIGDVESLVRRTIRE